MTNLEAITDDIRQVMEVLKADNDAADAVELSRYHDETMRLIYKYGFDAVVKIIVQCRNQAIREGKL